MDTYQQKKIVLFRLGVILLSIIFLCAALVVCFYLISQQMGSMIFAVVMGSMGACVSFFLRFPKLTKVELDFMANSWWSVIVPVMIGLVMGAIIYIVFFAGILTGDGGKGLFTSNLFPLFSSPEVPDGQPLSIKIAMEIRPVSVQDFGKLLVWCFLAGYSERLIPNILKNLEQRAAGGEAKD